MGYTPCKNHANTGRYNLWYSMCPLPGDTGQIPNGYGHLASTIFCTHCTTYCTWHDPCKWHASCKGRQPNSPMKTGPWGGLPMIGRPSPPASTYDFLKIPTYRSKSTEIVEGIREVVRKMNAPRGQKGTRRVKNQSKLTNLVQNPLTKEGTYGKMVPNGGK